jgi:protein ImuA
MLALVLDEKQPENPIMTICPPATHSAQRSAAQAVLPVLARQIRDMETLSRPKGDSISSGCSAIDRYLPNGGYACGSMVELIRNDPRTGTGVLSLALMMAKPAMANGKYLVIVDPLKQVYPPALQAMGIPLERLIALQPENPSDIVWGIDQAMRCSAVGAVICEMNALDDRIARRFQLAAEQGGGLGILVRDRSSAKRHPSWADVQWMINRSSHHVGTTPNTTVRWMELQLTRCSGGRTGARIHLGIDEHGRWHEGTNSREHRHEQASAMYLAAQLAQPTHRHREAAG